jgi:RNA polymerase sigma factor (sigma-70 family)
MNVQLSYKISKTSDLEKLINQQVEKLGRYLRVFRPDLIHLRGLIEENPAREGMVVSLNLRLPSGQMAAKESGATAMAAVKAAFESITEQVKKHKALLRNHHRWARRCGRESALAGTVPFEETLAAVKPEHISSADITSYVNINLPRLQRFIQRELDYRENQGLLQPGQVAVKDVLGEAIADALSEQNESPERMKLEPWVHRLALQAIGRLALENREDGHVSLEQSHSQQNVHASDEVLLQFHQPDEQLSEENVIPDPNANNPEELAARDELISLVETTLRDAGREQAEAFILYTLEGFTLEEIADITNRSVEEVRASTRKAREHLQRALPIKEPLKEKLVEYSRSA